MRADSIRERNARLAYYDDRARELAKIERREARRQRRMIELGLLDMPYSALVRSYEAADEPAPSRAMEGVSGYMGLDHLRAIATEGCRAAPKPSERDIWDGFDALPRSRYVAERYNNYLEADYMRRMERKALILSAPIGIDYDYSDDCGD